MSNNLRQYLITTLSLTLVVVFSSMVLAADPPKTPAKPYNKPFQLKDEQKLLVPLTPEQRRQMKMKMGPDGRPLPQIEMDRCPPSVIQEFSISEPSCSIMFDPDIPLLSYRVSPPRGFKIERVKIDHVSLVDGRRRTVYDRSASTMGDAWATMASESGIRDPGPARGKPDVLGPNVWGEYRLIVTSTCLGIPRIPATTVRNIRYRYRLPIHLEIGPSVQERKQGSKWRYTVNVSLSGGVDRIMVKAPPVNNSYQCLGDRGCVRWMSGSSGAFSFDMDTKLSERGVTSISYEASLYHPDGRGSCGENVVRSAILIADTTPTPSPEPAPSARWWDLRCRCVETDGVGRPVADGLLLNVSVKACMNRSTGAGGICGFVAFDLQRDRDVRRRMRPGGGYMRCGVVSVREHTDRGSCRSGAYSIIP